MSHKNMDEITRLVDEDFLNRGEAIASLVYRQNGAMKSLRRDVEILSYKIIKLTEERDEAREKVKAGSLDDLHQLQCVVRKTVITLGIDSAEPLSSRADDIIAAIVTLREVYKMLERRLKAVVDAANGDE